MSASPRPQKRTAHTCVTCRARKVRCDGRRGICTNCERLGFGCSYDESVGVEVVGNGAVGSSHDGNVVVVGGGSSSGSSHGPSTATINVPRRRVRQACLSCHAKKARCSGTMPKCDRCRAQGIECVYRPGKRLMALPSMAGSSVAHGGFEGDGPADVVMEEGGPSHGDGGSVYDPANHTNTTGSPAYDVPEPSEGIDALALRTFDVYFRHVYHIPAFSFLHRASVMERYHSGGLERCLLLAVIGITSLLRDLGPGIREYGDRCIDEAESLCLGDLERPSIITLQALVLVIKHRLLSRRFSSGFMLFAIASRFATALRLNHEIPTLCFLARESRRRLMWAIFLIDNNMANGQPDTALWADAETRLRIQLPCNERNFEFDLPETTEPLRPPPPSPDGTPAPFPDDLGFLALHARINWMRARVVEFTVRVVSNQTHEEIAKIPGACAALVTELEDFLARLPLSFRWSERDVRLRTYSPRLCVYAMTHVWWRQCFVDLYRVFLPGLKEALPQSTLALLDADLVAKGRQQCYEHARALADMFAQLLGLENGVPSTDIDLPTCALQCARVLYHGLQVGGMELGFTEERVDELATVCLKVAKQSTAGATCENIQNEIEKLIHNGLQLVASPAQAMTAATQASTTDSSSGTEMAYMAPTTTVVGGATQSLPDALPFIADPAAISTPAEYPNPIPIPGMMAPSGPLPVDMDMISADLLAPIPPAVAPSHTTEKTAASDAFEGALYDLNFGQDLFGGADAFTAFQAELFPNNGLGAGWSGQGV